MRSSKLRRWKQSADDAISPAHFGRERQTLAREIAARAFASTRTSPGQEGRIAALLNDFVLRVALASRYVATLQESATGGDYEDAGRLGRQAAWARQYLEEQTLCPLLLAAEDASPASERDSLDLLHDTLTRLIASQMGEADEAAA